MKYTELNKIHFIGIGLIAFLISNLPLLLFAQSDSNDTNVTTTTKVDIDINNVSEPSGIATIDTVFILDPETGKETIKVIVNEKKKTMLH